MRMRAMRVFALWVVQSGRLVFDWGGGSHSAAKPIAAVL